MVLLDLAVCLCLIIYFCVVVAILIGTYRHQQPAAGGEPLVSVVVAVRNEEQTIGLCLAALACQDYPKDRYEIIVVENDSIDRTAAVVRQCQATIPHLKLISIKEHSPELGGKQHALDRGMARAVGDIILLTDADCEPPPQWVRSMAASFTPCINLVCGYTIPGGKRTLWNNLQNLDYVFLLTVAQGMVGLGRPISCMGNNMAVRKAAYTAVGGYRQIGFSITEDYALCQAISGRDSRGVVFNARSGAVMRTQPMDSLGDFLKQRQRWAVGGLGHGKAAPLMLFFMLAMHLLLIAAFAASLWHTWQITLAASFFLIIIGTNFPLLFRGCAQIGNYRPLGAIAVFQLFYIFYTIVVAFLILGKRNVVWKDKSYAVRT